MKNIIIFIIIIIAIVVIGEYFIIQIYDEFSKNGYVLSGKGSNLKLITAHNEPEYYYVRMRLIECALIIFPAIIAVFAYIKLKKIN